MFWVLTKVQKDCVLWCCRTGLWRATMQTAERHSRGYWQPFRKPSSGALAYLSFTSPFNPGAAGSSLAHPEVEVPIRSQSGGRFEFRILACRSGANQPPDLLPLTREEPPPLTIEMPYRIILATSGFRVSTSCCETLTKAGEGRVRSANVIPTPPVEQKTCSTPVTRTVTIMLPVGPRNRTR